MNDPKSPPTIGRRERAPTGVPVVETPSPAEAVSASRASTSGPMQDKVGADGEGPERTFVLDFLDSRGRKWSGEFVVRILTIRDTVQLGLTKARLAGGVPLSALDGDTAYLLEVLAHLSVAIVASPPWAKDLYALHDAGVLAAIYEEVATFEARFRRPVAREAGRVDG